MFSFITICIFGGMRQIPKVPQGATQKQLRDLEEGREEDNQAWSGCEMGASRLVESDIVVC